MTQSEMTQPERTQSDRVVLITGATSGIGRDLARSLAAAGGVRLVLTGRDAARLAEVAADCAGVPTETVAVDLATADGPRRVVDAAVAAFGGIDTLVVNAGVYLGGDLADSDPDAVAALLDTNVTASIRLVRAALDVLLGRGQGDIVLVTSVSGYQDIQWEPVYSASKHAMVGFAHTLRRQLLEHDIRVMSVGPGVVMTELWGFEPGDDRQERRVADRDALRVSDVTEAIQFVLGRPRNVTIRDLVILPAAQDI